MAMAKRTDHRQQHRIPGTSHRITSIIQVLRYHADHNSERRAYTYLSDGETETASLTYSELFAKIQGVAAALQKVWRRGETAALLYPPGLDFIVAFYACLYSGIIPIPLYPPRQNRHDERLEAVLADSGTSTVLTVTDVADDPYRRRHNAAGLKNITMVSTNRLESVTTDASYNACDPNSLAFLQYTSGSTSNPRGVMVSHANLLDNQFVIHKKTRHSVGTVIAGWVPHFHDMGLVGNIIHAAYLGGHAVLLPPATFLRRPISFLRAISTYHAHTAGGPNFMYDYCVNGSGADNLDGIDLASWQVAFVGAEPVRAETMNRFAARFASSGFSPDAFYACYGLAESTLMVTGRRKGSGFRCIDISASQLRNKKAVTGTAGPQTSLVSCGKPYSADSIAIVDPDTCMRCPPRRIGEIWVSSPSVCAGYWRRTDDTERTFGAGITGEDHATWLRTGDLGFLYKQDLYVTGRLRDLIIIRGQNYHPEDLESVIRDCHPAVGLYGAVFTHRDDAEAVTVTFEIKQSHYRRLDADAVAAAIRKTIFSVFSLQTDGIALLKPGKTPRTTSGKIQRGKCRERYCENRLETVWSRKYAQLPAVRSDVAVLPPRDDPESQPPATLSAMPENRRSPDSASIEQWLMQRLARVREANTDRIDPKRAFAELGLDSVAAVGIADALAGWLQRPLEPTLLWEYATIRALAEHLGDPGTGPESAREEASSRDSAGRAALATTSTCPATQSVPTQRANEPVAIVGIGCRFPGGANDPASFWTLLHGGVDAVTEIPSDRWHNDQYFDVDPDTPGTLYTRHAALLDGVDQFDPSFFGISPREAAQMDPQQRLLAEVAWAALEDAGIAIDSQAAKQTGFFIGMCSDDYQHLSAPLADARSITEFSALGAARSVAAGRLPYLFRSSGPAIQLDTSCSSSLLAVHLACQSLHTGDCMTALAGGVNLILSPHNTIALCRLHALAADGRCKPFDASADGYGRGEGCGIVVLKTLSRAQADDDRILAVIRGSAMNSDGYSNGLTAPNGAAQEDVIRQAVARAGLEPGDIHYVEAHGTGTLLGDPIECQALNRALCHGRHAAEPLFVGSVKSNIGHLEAAAGVAGLIKVVLSIQAGIIPPSLHLNTPNPTIPWSDIPVNISTTSMAWPNIGDTAKRAGVSAFGLSGTNVHVVVEEAPATATHSTACPTPMNQADRAVHDPTPLLLSISARTDTALEQLCDAFSKRLANASDHDFTDICFTAGVGRTHFEQRLSIVADNAKSALTTLEARSATHASNVYRGQVNTGNRVVWTFTDAACLPLPAADAFPATVTAFHTAYRDCTACIDAFLADPADNVEVSQRLSRFRFAYAVSALWRSWGIRPDALLGSGSSVAAAACVADAIGLKDGIALAAARMDGAEAVDAALGRTSFRAPNVPLFLQAGSTSYELDAVASWLLPEPDVDSIRAGTNVLMAQGYNVFHEMGMQSVASGDFGRFTANNRVLIPSGIHQAVSAYRQVLTAAAQLHVHGVAIDHNALWCGRQRRKVSLPAYPLQRKAYPVFPQNHEQARHLVRATAKTKPAVDGLYSISWLEQPLVPSQTQQPPRTWIVFGDRRGLGEAVKNKLTNAGAACFFVKRGRRFKRLSARRFVADPTDPEGLRKVLNEVCETNVSGVTIAGDKDSRQLGILYLWALDLPETAALNAARLRQATANGCGDTVCLLQALAAVSASVRTRVWLVTQDAQASEDAASGVAQAPLWGLGAAAMQEYPEWDLTLIDIPRENEASWCAAIFDEVSALDRENRVLYSDGRRYLQRLTPASTAFGEVTTIRGDGSYLITGGLGDLGRITARWLIDRGARHLVLAGRSNASSSLEKEICEWRAKGVDTRCLATDVGNARDLSRALAVIRDSMQPLRGVVHAAGVADDGLVADLTRGRFTAVLKPKVMGAWNLHVCTRELSLDFFICYSSVAAILGSTGQTGYAAANAFMDTLMRHRTALGLPGRTINWGPWEDIGMMKTTSDDLRKTLIDSGVKMIDAAYGTRTLDYIFSTGVTQTVVFPVDQSRFARSAVALPAATLFNDFSDQGVTVPPLLAELKAAPPTSRQVRIVDYLRDVVATIFEHKDADDIGTEQLLQAFGATSLTAVQMKRRIARDLAVTIPIERLFNVTIADLSIWLDAQLDQNETVHTDTLGANTASTELVEIVI